MHGVLVGDVPPGVESCLSAAGFELERVALAELTARLRVQPEKLIVSAINTAELRQLVNDGGGTVLACVATPDEVRAALAAGATDALILPGDEARLLARARLASEKAAAAAQQRRFELEHFAFIERAADGVFSHGGPPNFVVTYSNPAFLTCLGYSTSEEVIGKPVLELVHPEDRPYIKERIRSIFSTGVPTRPRELRMLGKDGSPRWVETRGIIVPTVTGPIVTVMARDLTERRRARDLSEQLHQSQKMEAIGRLAGGVAHDFNNILTTIRGYGDLLLERVEAGSSAHDAVQRIRRSATRAAALTEQLLVFTRRRPPQPRIVQLNDIVRHMGGLLRRVITEDIRLELELEPNLGMVKVDPGQMEQMILNLAINARDAMDKGGRLGINTRNDGTRSIRLTVEDDGHGMDEDTRSRIFEPFFTTKSVGKGTGLGLSIVHAIVEQSGGAVTVDSAPGKGARFHILLPRVPEEESRASRTTPLPSPAMPSGHETILVAEDDDEVRDFVEHVLRAKGYRVVVARDGAEALRKAQEFAGEIQLLLSDVVMPHINGRQLAERLQPLRPTLKVLHMSGYPGDTIAQYGDVRDGDFFLQKPFSARELAEKVREVLDSAQ